MLSEQAAKRMTESFGVSAYTHIFFYICTHPFSPSSLTRLHFRNSKQLYNKKSQRKISIEKNQEHSRSVLLRSVE